MSRFMHERYRGMHEYVPGEQPRERKYIKLNTNENPYPPSGEVLDAVKSFDADRMRHYPDPDASSLSREIAAHYGVNPENVIISNGSDDILNMAFMAFGGSGAIFPDITYGFYPVFAALHGVRYKESPLNSDFTVNVRDFEGTGRFTVIANPNAPTGLALPLCEIERIVRSNPDAVVLIDEAYVDFGGESAVSLTHTYDNLLVVMTFSKSRSLAGLRLGFAIGNEALIRDLYKIKYSTNPYNVNALSAAAGTAAMRSSEYYRGCCQKIISTRRMTQARLCERGFHVTDSSANFIFAEHPEIKGVSIYEALRRDGILVRRFDTPRIENYIRITVGTDEEMAALLTSLEKIIDEYKGGTA